MIEFFYHHDRPFQFEAGGQVKELNVAFHASQLEYDGTRKVIWICHALTANSDAQDWWPQMVGPGKLLDTEKYYVICANMLCSPYGSSGPASPKPSEEILGEEPYLFDFPKTTVRDIVRANILVRKHLGINKIDLLIGASIGGFQALEWAVMEPECISRSVFMACSARLSPWMAAWEESQRMALEADGTFRNPPADDPLSGGREGLKAARSIALISYRSAEGYNATQADEPDFLFAQRACSYQRYQGKKLADRFDAYSYYYLSYSVDSANIGRGRGGVEAALRKITMPCVVIGIDSDRLFPIEEPRYIANHLPKAEFYTISSKFGHDGFLLEYPQLTEILSKYL